jgi:hypothetical protein
MRPSALKVRIAVAALAVALPPAVRAYETPVHASITQVAFIQALKERDFLADMGILHYFDSSGALFVEAILDETPDTWARVGAVKEDDFVRSSHHFFDPQVADPLQSGFKGLFQAAPDWALDGSNNPTWSIPGTRDSMFGALTNTDPIVRPKQMRDTFRGVGQFTHLLQDMAQPQHVRDDNHFSLTEQFYYLFPDYSRYEKRTLWLNQVGLLNFGNYGSVDLPDYRSYWTAAGGKGLAQFVNLNFVSEHTNLDGSKYSQPTGTLLQEEVIPQVVSIFGTVVATNVTVQYVSNTFTDNYQGGSGTNNRLSTFSLFDFQSMQTVGRHVYSLNNANHDTYAALLIPRAVGYSAGLMKRFFRGRLEITPPDDGVYGVVDHSATHQTDPLGGFVGFDTVKLKVANTSPNGETMDAGKVVAVAKFHRNGCYKDDLTGEFPPSLAPPCPNYRTNDEEIVVSAPMNGVAIGAAAQPLTFTFPQQIPINATDLYVQVVYQGKLGGEDSAVVVATHDVSEATYLSLFNSTDRILLNGTFYALDDPVVLAALDQNHDGVIDPQFDATNLQVLFSFRSSFVSPLGTIAALPPGRYARIAVLAEGGSFNAPIQGIGVAFNGANIYDFPTAENQLDIQSGAYNVASVEPLRGVPTYASLTFYRFVGSPSDGDLDTLPALTDKTPFALTSLTFKP